MTEENSYSDHDLLILLLERSRVLAVKFEEYTKMTRDEISDIKDRITIVERILDKQSGFFSGAKWIWGILGSIPPSILLLLLNK